MNWYKKQKKTAGLSEKAKNEFDNYGLSVIEKENEQGYELYLVKGYAPTLGDVYQVGLQRSGFDFTSIEHQTQKQETSIPKDIYKLIDFFKLTLEKWISQYGKLMVASFNELKQEKYLNILRSFGFNIEKKNIMGKEIIFIS